MNTLKMAIKQLMLYVAMPALYLFSFLLFLRYADESFGEDE